jgi:hypothetical protein
LAQPEHWEAGLKVWQRRFVGILSLGGGALGAALALQLMFSSDNALGGVACLLFAATYGWGMWCGVRLLEAQAGASRSAFWYWLIQVPAFGSPFAGYFLTSGFHVTALLFLSPLKLSGAFLLGSTLQYSIMQPEQAAGRDQRVRGGDGMVAVSTARPHRLRTGC